MVEALDRPSSYYVVRQPIFHLEDESPVGAELLSRSRVPSFQSPDDFFRLCTESNLLLKVDHLCLKLCLQASLHLPSGFRCHLNLFPSTLVSLPLPELLGTLDGGRLLGGYCVEISEQQIIGNPSYLAEPVKALKRAGIEVAIDDVGFGRSCLESLVLLEPDVVKIDKRFVLGIARDGRRVQSLKRLLRVAGSLGAEVIAEGIECREDLECLKGLEVPLGQGFLWGQPTPVLAGSFSASAKN